MTKPACKTCKHWGRKPPPREGWIDPIIFPQTEDSDEGNLLLMRMPFEVFKCKHPEMTFCERPVDRNGFGVADGSGYRAALYTAEDFGCVRWEIRP